MISNVHQIVCMYRVLNMSMIFKETCHLHCVINLLLVWRRSGDIFITWCYRPRLSTWRLNLFVLRLVQPFLWGHATFWGGQYFDRFAIDQWISIFCAFNTGTVGKSNKGNCTGMMWLDVYLRDIALTHTTTTHAVAVACGLCGSERSEAKTALSISTHTGWNKTV